MIQEELKQSEWRSALGELHGMTIVAKRIVTRVAKRYKHNYHFVVLTKPIVYGSRDFVVEATYADGTQQHGKSRVWQPKKLYDRTFDSIEEATKAIEDWGK